MIPAEYEMVITVLTTTSDDLSLDDIVAKLLPVEQRLSQQRETVAAYSARGDHRQRKPYGQQQDCQTVLLMLLYYVRACVRQYAMNDLDTVQRMNTMCLTALASCHALIFIQ